MAILKKSKIADGKVDAIAANDRQDFSPACFFLRASIIPLFDRNHTALPPISTKHFILTAHCRDKA